MPSSHKLDLSTFDNQLLDGLVFCGKVYDLFDQIRATSGGINRLRLRSTILEKRLVEELIPIAHYIQARYREGRRVKARWYGGSQPFDAVLWWSGEIVKFSESPRSTRLEVTTSGRGYEHHLVAQILQEQFGSFGPRGIRKEKKTRRVVSAPKAYDGYQTAVDLSDQILERLTAKEAKQYPRQTILIVNCMTDTIILLNDWDEAIRRVRQAHHPITFREVFLLEPVMGHSATLYRA